MESILNLYQFALIVLPVYGFVSLRKLVRAAELSRPRAVLRYAGIVLIPIPAYSAIYAFALGIEKLSGFELVPEEIARSFPLAIALGVVLWFISVMVFAVAICFVRSTVASMSPK